MEWHPPLEQASPPDVGATHLVHICGGELAKIEGAEGKRA